MNLKEAILSSETLLYQACVSYIKEIKKDLKNEKVYAFAIRLGDDWDVYASTYSYLEKQKDNQDSGPQEFIDPDFYLELYGDEWGYIGEHYELLNPFNDKRSELLNFLYDDINRDSNQDAVELVDKMYVLVAINVLKRLKKNELFNNSCFEKDLFLSIHLPDSGLEGALLMEKASIELNSEHWKLRVKQYMDYCKSIE